MDTHYQRLGVTRNATAIEVKAAFQQKMKALEASPVQGERRKAEEKLLQQAFLTLLDPTRRAKYDKQVDAAAAPLVVVEDAKPRVSMLTVVVFIAAVAGAVAAGWYVKHPSAEKQAQERKDQAARNRAARDRLETAGPKGNPNPFRNAPDSEIKDRILKQAIERESKQK